MTKIFSCRADFYVTVGKVCYTSFMGKLYEDNYSGSYEGKLLLAMPAIQTPPFSRSVVYVCAHSSEGAMGIVLNKPSSNLRFRDLLKHVGIADDDQILVDDEFTDFQIIKGGPVETGRGFVLHSPDFQADGSTIYVGDKICLTSTLEIVRSIASGHGPKDLLFALGYAGWAGGQLEDEIVQNSWITCDATEELIFKVPYKERYQIALHSLGIDPTHLSQFAGHA